MTWKPNLEAKQEIDGFVEDLFSAAPEILGIDEIIAGCEVIDMDPYATGVLPRYIRVALGGTDGSAYYQDILYRGQLAGLAVTDFVTVVHLRQGNRYEIMGPGGAGGTFPPGVPAPGAAGWALVSDATPEWTASATPTWLGDHTWGSGFDINPTDATGQALGDATHRWDLHTQDVYFEGATGANVITVPDNVADALHVSDVGGLEYMRTVSTDANPYILFDPVGAGINVGIGIVGPGDRLHIRDAAVNADVGIRIGNDAEDWRIRIMGSDGDKLYFRSVAGAKNVMVLTPTTGYVGIGITGPTANVHIQGTAAAGTLVGSATTATMAFYINNKWTTQGTRYYAAVNFLEVDLGAASAERFYAGYDYVNVVSNDNITGRVEGRFIGVRHSGTGTIDNVYGIQGYVATVGAGTVTSTTAIEGQIVVGHASAAMTNCAALRANIGMSAAGSITTAYGVYVLVAEGTGTIGTGYGIFIYNVDATTSYGIYQAGAGDDNYFAGHTTFGAGITFTGASGANEITIPDNIAIALELLDAGGLEYMRIVSTNANPYFLIDPAAAGVMVGIGVTPSDLLHLRDPSAAADAGIRIGNDDEDWRIRVMGSAGDRLYFSSVVGATTVLVLDPAGGIGMGAPIPGDRLHLQDSAVNADVGLRVGNDAEDWRIRVMGSAADKLQFTSVAGATIALSLSVAGAIQFPAYGAGDLQTDAAGNITAVSDARLKQDIELLDIGLVEILQLRGKRWRYAEESGLDTEHWYQGFVADDIEKVVPAAVGRNSEGMRTMSYSSLMPAFAQAIREIDERLIKLELSS